MNYTATYLPYSATGYFSKMLSDYIGQDKKLSPFYNYPVSTEGIKASIAARKKINTNRSLLVTVLKEQYKGLTLTKQQEENINKLADENTFTTCTAHQPNIFTGPLYFIYKILHAVKLADNLCKEIPGAHFVPVYYMGSEDADLDELGHIYIEGEKKEWKTKQTGAVGRMKVDKALLQMIEQLSGQITVQPHGNDIIAVMRECYKEGITIEQATFKLVNNLFAKYGLLVLLPDNAVLKNEFAPVIEKELLSGFSAQAVQETMSAFPVEYKVQAAGRDINLFYLTDTARERIVLENEKYLVNNTSLEFSKDEILVELKKHPERFSPNVILRPVFQETILPNIAFIGGGGEIAYWLELKKVFEAAGAPYPMLITRNSFLLVEKKYKALAEKLKLNDVDLFKPAPAIINELVKRESKLQLNLANEKQQLSALYEKLKTISGDIDTTLVQHTEALQVKALKRIETLEKKLLKAEKKKFEAEQRHVQVLKQQLFPNNSLQERIENFMLFYAKWGSGFMDMLYDKSLVLEQQFCIIDIE